MRRSRTKAERSGSQNLHAVILAGGAGERFWPASRSVRPKPFLKVIEGRTLLEATLDRAKRFASPDRIWVVCGREHARAVRAETGLPAERVLEEPRRRNTAMAVARAALRLAAEDRDAVMAVLPADHRISDARSFASAIRRAASAASQAGVLVTLGVQPTRPDPGYGYLEIGAPAGGPFRGLHWVRRFVEKPSAAQARRYLRNGRYLWNAGIFVWTVRTILEELEACAPDVYGAVAALGEGRRRSPRAALETAYRRAPSLSIDYAVLERSRRVWTVPVEFTWSDVGTWASLAEELGVRPDRSRVIAGDVLLDDAAGNLVWGGKRTIALLGVEGLAVIDAGDVILVTKLERSPDVRRLVARLRAMGRRDLI